MSIEGRTPCLIGVAQRTWHLGGDEWAPEPLAMQAEVVRAAATDAEAANGGESAVLAAIGSVGLVYSMSWDYDDPVARLNEAVGMTPAHSTISSMSGTSHQSLQLAAARRILAGDLDVAVVVGAESLDTKRRLRWAGRRPEWSHRAEQRRPPPFDFDFLDAEVSHEFLQAYLTFALRDVARRAHRRLDVETHRRSIGDLLAPMTRVAAANPHAWFPNERSADDLVTATPENRMVAYPYTKATMAIMDVDMAAATVLASHDAAERLGVPRDRRVYLRGSAEADDARYVAEHPDLWRSPAMEWCASTALVAAGIGLDDLAHLDLYSCFASSITFALDALGIDAEKSGDRAVTVTGGLPFGGGPACNVLGHTSASMVERLRSDPGSFGLVTGVGMHLTKHCWAIWSSAPGPIAPAPSPPVAVVRPVRPRHTGPVELVAYTVLHGRDGSPEWGAGIGELDDGSRCYLRFDDRAWLDALEAEEWTGRRVHVAGEGDVNRVHA